MNEENFFEIMDHGLKWVFNNTSIINFKFNLEFLAHKILFFTVKVKKNE